MKTIKPFQRSGHFTMFDNWLLDVARPKMKPSAWSVFCEIYRKTQGWQRSKVELTHRQIMAGTGIKSVNTIKKALKYLKEEGLITVIRTNGSPDMYCLNLELEVSDPHQKMTPPPKNDTLPPSKNGGGPPPKNDTLIKKGKEKEKKKDPAGTAAADSKLNEILLALNTVSGEMKKPLAAPKKLAETLIERGETKDSILNAWKVCKQNATRSVGGSFINWINNNYLPTFRLNSKNGPTPPNSAAPPPPKSARSSVGGNMTESEWAARQPIATGDEVVSRSRRF